jgi:DNA helicase-2/ATP-dependent DNA helicase PcrA
MEAEGRMENLLEFVAQMREYEREAEEPSLHGFLERIALVSDVDGYDPDKGAISLMTVHTAKGLEFPVVFLTGLEERIFPHARSVDDDSAVEEERRLCYVAVTRARTTLHLSRVRRRRLSGQELPGVPSRFLRDLPAGRVEAIVMARPPEYGGAYGDSEGRGPWGGRWSRDEPEEQRSRLPPPRRAPAARTAAHTPGEIRVEYDDDQGSGLQVGAKLRHPSFGVGEVRAWQGAGADMKVTMRFPGVGVKTILARFLTRP